MQTDDFIAQHAQRRVNLAVLARLNRMVSETRAEIARERMAVRLLVPALLLLGIPYAGLYFGFDPFLAVLRTLTALRSIVC
jgi:hypothetical protein